MKILIIALLICAFGIIGSMDYEDEQSQQDIYCDMVSEGSWPDYDKSIECGE
jgi:predicted outer membrane lipoprotein